MKKLAWAFVYSLLTVAFVSCQSPLLQYDAKSKKYVPAKAEVVTITIILE